MEKKNFGAILSKR